MKNIKKQKRVWSAVQIGHALIWAAVLLMYSWYFKGESFSIYVFNLLIFIAGMQVTVLGAAKDKIFKKIC